ncbi:PepSY-associated TM helix domain-containing protein [Paracoccus aminophilus]|uniref:Iron-regulated membrane protein n=1 Tax=Paracoccus aminophilus JCM 7686 TaxID=1367847 RepID=S5YIB8_PARAH|nr:PepSY-associated TM helix domain-containing protein [Paracoccus aminophilus]AGT11223.1 iron-regulated membrane protein [Paracoccus aminophilus JCM 7686]
MTDTTFSAPRSAASTGAWRAFLMRMHFYIGLLVGPFLFVAALTGTLYVLTPQIERMIYSDALHTATTGTPQPLGEQIKAARKLGGDGPIKAVRPAPAAGETTRVMFVDSRLGPSETRTIFVDPVTLNLRGDMTTYGTSGILPFRTALDYLHQSLMLGDWGRYYSELAASWLWVVTLGGVLLWAGGSRRRRKLAEMPKPQRLRWVHATIGVSAAIVLLFLSVTGLTWSQAAGARIDQLRGALGWVTPSVDLSLDGSGMSAGEHAEHLAAAADMLDKTGPELDDYYDVAMTSAQYEGLDSPYLEIRPPQPGKAWLVTEYDRSWPTQVDAMAVDPVMFTVTSQANFKDFPLIPKLIRWGIDAHMGVLFGLPNQILMAAVGIALMFSTVYGYRIWWLRRPVPGALPQTLTASWARLGLVGRLVVLLIGAGLAWALPVLGVSLILFLLIDLTRWKLASA